MCPILNTTEPPKQYVLLQKQGLLLFCCVWLDMLPTWSFADVLQWTFDSAVWHLCLTFFICCYWYGSFKHPFNYRYRPGSCMHYFGILLFSYGSSVQPHFTLDLAPLSAGALLGIPLWLPYTPYWILCLSARFNLVSLIILPLAFIVVLHSRPLLLVHLLNSAP